MFCLNSRSTGIITESASEDGIQSGVPASVGTASIFECETSTFGRNSRHNQRSISAKGNSMKNVVYINNNNNNLVW